MYLLTYLLTPLTDTTDKHCGQRDKRTNGRTDEQTDEETRLFVRPSPRWSLILVKRMLITFGCPTKN